MAEQFDDRVDIRSGGVNRVHLDAGSQRLEIRNADGKIIAMIGGAGNIRAGTNGEGGDLYLYPAGAGDIFNNGQARVWLDGNSGNLDLRDGGATNRVHLDAANQRLEIRNADGKIIAMIGGAGNIRAGGNGEGGDLYLYPSTASDIFNNGQASIHLNGEAGDIILQNADCAEDFEVEDQDGAEPGTVMVIAESSRLRSSDSPYDRRVAGVVAGAGTYRPGLVLGRTKGRANALPIALMGRVFCRVDAEQGAVSLGDLLTTSPSRGCAMKAADPARAFGAILGKALAPWQEGVGLIPILVTLQ